MSEPRRPSEPPASPEAGTRAERAERERAARAARIDRATLIALVHGDEELLARLAEAGLLDLRAEIFASDEAEAARVAWTLVRQLEVNWEGMEIILRMRAELVATRRQVADLIELLGGR